MYNRRFINNLKTKYKKGGVKKYQNGGGPEIDSDGNIFMNQTTPISQQTTSKVRKRLISESPNLENSKKTFNLTADEYNTEKSIRRINSSKQTGAPANTTSQEGAGLTFGDKLDIALTGGGTIPGWGMIPDALNTVQNLVQAGYNTLTGDYDEAWYDFKNAGAAAFSILPATQGITLPTKAVSVADRLRRNSKKLTDITSRYNRVTGQGSGQSTGGGASFTQGYNQSFSASSPTKTTINLSNKNSEGLIVHPKFGGQGKGPKSYDAVSMGPYNTFTQKLKKRYKNSISDLKEPIIEWKGPSLPFPVNLTGRGAWWGKDAFWRTNVQRQITPLDIAVQGGVWQMVNVMQNRMIEKVESDLQIRQDLNDTQNIRTADSTEYQNNTLQNVPTWNPKISAGANIYQLVHGNAPQIESLIMQMDEDPSIQRTDLEVQQLFISKFPDTLGSSEEAANFYDGEQKQTGGIRQKQSGGSYMGVPQEQPVGDEGYMGQMKQFGMGGQNLPGGNVQQIPGSDAVQFNGQTHDQGGIMMDSQTEVEDGETMDKVNMAKQGGPKDYFFSSHLKKGGRSYAEHHKSILQNGGGQEDIDILAKMQEKAAGRDPNAVQTASHGGYRKYANGGEQDVYGGNYSGFERALKTSGYEGSGVGGTVSGADVGDVGYNSLQGKNKQMVGGNLTHTGYYGEIGPAEREDFFNRNKDVMNSIGITNWEDFDPAVDTDKFQSAFNTYLTEEYNTNPDFADNLKAEGINDLDGLITTAGFHDKGHGSKKLDGFYGSYTHGKTSFFNQEKTPDPEACKCRNVSTGAMIEHPCEGPLPPECKEGDLDKDKGCPCGTEPETYSDECCEDGSSTHIDRTFVGAAQLLPAAYAFAEGPDYMSEHKMASPGAIIPERLAKTHLERVDMNADRAKNQADYQSMGKFVETAGLGSSGMAAKMAAYSRKQQGDLAITDAENKANTAIGNQEALADQTRKTTNVANALDASKFNVTSQSDANKQNAVMGATVDEFNRASDSAVKDRRLMALDSATKTMAGMYSDNAKLQGQERMADAISGQTGIAERNRYSMQLLQSNNYTGTSDPKYIEAMDAYNRMNAPKKMRYGGYRRRH